MRSGSSRWCATLPSSTPPRGEIRHWRVETRQGTRSFQTRLDAWPRLLPHGGLLIRDVAGDLYHLGEPGALDHHSRALLWAFVD